MNLILNQLVCSLADDKHIVACAVGLSCGHFICKKCIPSNSNQVRCLNCHKINEHSLDKSNEFELVRLIIDSNLSSLVKTTREKIETEYSKYTSN